MVKKDFMSTAVKRPGVFAAKAKKAGKSTSAYATQVVSKSQRAGKSTSAYATQVVKKLKGKTKTAADRRLLKQATLAKTFAKYRPKKKY